ncbi:MAG: FMN-binding protein [Spirochaetes bacterium]|nr:FMN-binding protein [Spirochaetota bacterium]
MKPVDIIKATIIISVIGFISAFSLSFMKKITQEPIIKQEQEKKLAALALVLPGYTIEQEKTVTIDNEPFTYWSATKQENRIVKKAWAFLAHQPAYAGSIESVVGVDSLGTIIGFTILSQNETPGLGARCVEVVSNETFIDHFITKNVTNIEEVSWFQQQFIGLNAGKPIAIVKKGDWHKEMKDELLPNNAVTAITGATITTKAVTQSIEEGMKKLHKALALQEVK